MPLGTIFGALGLGGGQLSPSGVFPISRRTPQLPPRLDPTTVTDRGGFTPRREPPGPPAIPFEPDIAPLDTPPVAGTGGKTTMPVSPSTIGNFPISPLTISANLPIFGGIPITIGTGGGNPAVPGGIAQNPSGGAVCFPPFFRNPLTGACELDLVPGAGGGGTGPQRTGSRPIAGGGGGMGGSTPGVQATQRRTCFTGMVLGRDGLCYDKRAIRNSDRMWPKARRPLGTPGELSAVSKASRFGKRLKTTEKRLKRLGKDLGCVTRRGR